MTLKESFKKPVALWAVPRSISTAFERAFVEREDFEVLHEPFSASYYYSEDRLSDRYPEEEARPENNYQSVLEEVVKPRERRVFLKDMAYHAKGLIDSEGERFAARFVNTFIVRDPKYVISSLGRMWPDFTEEEAGYEDLYRLFRLATGSEEEVAVVDAMSFTEDPEGVLERYCEYIDVPFERDSLSWEPGKVESWESWDGWHDAAEKSARIEPATRRDPEIPSDRLDVYENSLPAYYKLAASAIPARQSK